MTLARPAVPADLLEDEPAQILAPDGQFRPCAELEPYADRTVDFLKRAYAHMVRSRAFDAEATSLQRQGELALWAPSRGQEGIQVGSALATPMSDPIIPSYREHPVAEVRGLDLTRLMGVFRGVNHGGWDPAAHNFHLYTFVIAAHLPHAVGRALALQQDARRAGASRSEDVVLTYFGDGSTSQGEANEALVFAASARAPIVFICQNNGWAISVPTSVQSIVPLATRPLGFGIPSLRVDGNDPVASYAATRLALEHARAGRGPFFIEAVTYRMGAHTTSDDPTRYRTSAEEEYWAERCPIARTRAALSHEYSVGEDFFEAVDGEADALRRRIRDYTRSLEPVAIETMTEHVYGTEHAQVRASHEALAADADELDLIAEERKTR
ncbi:MAG: thiamine pyrophosphate-dependent enzyme [Bowdeniella nasicola]|nr:thiamine pyrophosphate-dependent enzyme [Bowdeniella nasicola]